jgi:hypothetical protein
VKKFYYIGVKDGKSFEGVCRHESIDVARRKLEEEGVEDINLAILKSDNIDFIDLDSSAQEAMQ